MTSIITLKQRQKRLINLNGWGRLALKLTSDFIR